MKVFLYSLTGGKMGGKGGAERWGKKVDVAA